MKQGQQHTKTISNTNVTGRTFLLLLLLTLVSACSSNYGRYQQRNDSAPQAHEVPHDIAMHDAVPKVEPYYPASLRAYNVLGRTYQPMSAQQAVTYSATGQASWYGQKFHGHLTANGEVYDMYQMTAAHKTLPLPSYVRLTNLKNDKQVIVRVNDRGPFHGHRLIDVSYAAAKKLDMLNHGVANIKLDVVTLDESGQMLIAGKPLTPQQNAPELQTEYYVQVAALSDSSKINKLAKGLAALYQIGAQTPEENGVFRLRLGPLKDTSSAQQLLKKVQQGGYPNAFTLSAPQ
ncbi:septal ring lytic transglycosylase RlpA family protein [Neptunicella marina]|uniref:Endolytic peptidoglycan transglycosylase RlpA n=1 Tax=Neptunicella marina TaxID=2125989 RepID=A0A8J6INR6_9ALTE|nr:septal ring lytic transglycosylase RlpA family protein [Neptunicella marina]